MIETAPQPKIGWTCPVCRSIGTCDHADIALPESRPSHILTHPSGLKEQVPAWTPPAIAAGFKCPSCGQWLAHVDFTFPVPQKAETCHVEPDNKPVETV